MKENEYREQLLEKYDRMLIRSEQRVDNINHMIGNLIEQNRMIHERLQACNEVVKSEQETTKHLLDIIGKKDERIDYLEKVLDRYINHNSINNQNNFKI